MLEPLPGADKEEVKELKEIKPQVVKRKYRRGMPTIMQVRALQYINQGMSKRAAMIKAGYSKSSAINPGKVLMNKKGVKNILISMAGELNDAGLTTEYMVAKFKEWLEAEKSSESGKSPDYEIQLKAYKEWKKVMDEQAGDTLKPGVKRKLTIEEFIKD